MRLLYVVLIVSATVLVSSDVVAVTADSERTKVSKLTPDLPEWTRSVSAGQNDDAKKRFLRVDSPGVDDDNEEERSIASLAKDATMKIKMKSWLHKDKLPTDIFNKLGLRGLGQGKVKDGKNYKYYKRYMELWKKKDAAYQTKMDKKLDLWLTMKLLPTDVYRQLGLRGVKSNVRNHKDYPFYAKYMTMWANAQKIV